MSRKLIPEKQNKRIGLSLFDDDNDIITKLTVILETRYARRLTTSKVIRIALYELAKQEKILPVDFKLS